MKKIILAIMITVVSLIGASFNQCAPCHGAKAQNKALGQSHVIAGWNEAKIIAALEGYKKGTYGGAMKAVMQGQVAHLTNADIKKLAKTIHSFKR